MGTYGISWLTKEFSEHQSYCYSSIWGKEIYPVAMNPLDDDDWCGKNKYEFGGRNRYFMVR